MNEICNIPSLEPAIRGNVKRIMNYFRSTTKETIEDGSLFLESKSAVDAGVQN